MEEIKRGIFDINPDEVFNDARDKGLEVESVEDFRNQVNNYKTIENLMDHYVNDYARQSIIGGATSGIGGVATSVTLSGLELTDTAIRLYRLSQRLAILNGFDPRHPLHEDKIYHIYIKTLGLKAASQTAIKFILFRSSNSNNHSVSERLFLSVITRIARKIGTDISSNHITKFIPVVGGVVGGYASYNYAQDTGHSMRDAFKDLYHKEWNR